MKKFISVVLLCFVLFLYVVVVLSDSLIRGLRVLHRSA